MSKLGEKLRVLKSSAQEPFLLKVALVGMVLSILGLGYSSYALIQHLRAASTHNVASAGAHSAKTPNRHVSSEQSAEATHESSAAHGDDPQAMISAEILSRQDGIPETDNDLKDPVKSQFEVFKEGLNKKEIAIQKAHYFVSIGNISSSAKEGNDSSAGVYATVTLDLTTAAAEKEVAAQINELRNLITAIISEKQRADLMDGHRGIADLKIDIRNRAQHLVKSGEIQDVLLEKYFFK